MGSSVNLHDRSPREISEQMADIIIREASSTINEKMYKIDSSEVWDDISKERELRYSEWIEVSFEILPIQQYLL